MFRSQGFDSLKLTLIQLMKLLLLLAVTVLLSKSVLAQDDVNYEQQESAGRNLREVTISTSLNHYNTDSISASLKLAQKLLQVPQNIQEIDKTLISDQQAINVNESLTRNVSGATRSNVADLYGPMIMMRGAAIGTLRNGIDLGMSYYGPVPEDAAIIERIEFVKGPAGFLSPIGDPAGLYNIVTKSPTGNRRNQIRLTAGSFNLYRLSGDFDGNLDKSKKWLFRLNLAGQKAKSFQKFAFQDKLIAQPVIRYQINSRSTLIAEYQYNRQSFQQYLATVFSPDGFASLPRSFSISDPNKIPARARESNYFLTYRLQMSTHWALTAKASVAQNRMDGNYFLVSSYNPAKPNLLPRRLTYEKFNSGVLAAQAFINGGFKTGRIEHRILSSPDYNRKNFLGYAGYNDPAAGTTVYLLDLSNPVYGIPISSQKKEGKLSDIATNQHRIRYFSAYLQDEVALAGGMLRLSLAGRFTASKSSILKPRQTSVSDAVLTPRIGLNYQIRKNFYFYGLWDQTFTPQSGLNTSGGIFKPLKGNNLEAGLKKDWRAGKLSTTLSVYDITRDNILVSDPVNRNIISQIGQTKSKGIEVDLKGEVFTGMNLVINYAYTDSYISRDADERLVGIASPFLVKHIQNSWLHYKLPFKKVRGFSVSAGYQFQAGRNGRYPQDIQRPIANLFRADAGIGWANSHLFIQGLVNNISNRFNYGSSWTRPAGLSAYTPFAPREFRLSIGFHF